MPAFHHTEAVLDRAVASRVFPGAVVEIGRRDRPLATLTRGRLRYDEDSAAVSPQTIYDLASLTKVLATTAVVLEMVLGNRLRLEDPVSRWIESWTAGDREGVTIQDLLEHCSGLPSHRKYFETLSGRAAYELTIASEPLAYLPRWQSIYSDPGSYFWASRWSTPAARHSTACSTHGAIENLVTISTYLLACRRRLTHGTDRGYGARWRDSRPCA